MTRSCVGACSQIPTPEHRSSFWADLKQRLVREGLAHSPVDDVSRSLGPTSLGPTAAVDGVGEVDSQTVVELRPGRGDQGPSRWRLLVSAAAVVIVALAVGTRVVADRDDGIGVTFQRGSDTSTPITADTITPDASTPTTTVADTAAAERAALEWLDLLAAGDLQAAWERLAPSGRDAWSSLEAFAASRTAFAEGMALWTRAEGRRVGTAKLETMAGESIYVVTITGTRYPEGKKEDSALAILVRTGAADGFLVDPFSPTSAGRVRRTGHRCRARGR